MGNISTYGKGRRIPLDQSVSPLWPKKLYPDCLLCRGAENEGFSFGDGAKPTSRPGNNLYVVNKDWTICHVGMAGHMAYQSAKKVGDQMLIRIDYEKYILY